MERRVRVYRKGDEVIIYTPSDRYQGDNFNQCPHHGRAKAEEFDSIEVKTFSELAALVDGKNEAGGAQFYYEGDVLKHDNDRSELLMHPSEIKSKHMNRLARKLDEELAKETPDPVKVVRLQRDREKVKDMTDKEAYAQALANLDEDGLSKPKIRQKLQEKIG